MAIPIDANTRVGEAFVTTVERNVLIDPALVRIDIAFDALESSLFLNRKHKDQIAFGPELGLVQRANGSQQCFDIAGVVSNPGRVNSTIPNRSFDLQAR